MNELRRKFLNVLLALAFRLMTPWIMDQYNHYDDGNTDNIEETLIDEMWIVIRHETHTDE